MRATAAVLALPALLVSPLVAEAQTATSSEAVLESYEPNTVGFTKDSDDERFLDVKLSLRYPLMPNAFRGVFPNSELSFAATVRFAQYIDTRASSPVIGKRFNPKLIWRRFTPSAAPLFLQYLDFAYAHESNGQSINTHEEYLFEVRRQEAVGNRPEAAKDFISRGWDYLEVASKHGPQRGENRQLTIYSSFRYFLPEGLLQEKAEEYNTWEDDLEGKPRKEVQGLALFLKHETWFPDAKWLKGVKLGLGLETGYSRPFRYNTLRLEARGDLAQLPILVFYQNGYNSDLALYYKRVSTIGIALELGTKR